ncbi:response regulator [Blastomonas aquatica]|uniref:Response regulatory domain-containing protein n=1 Tax=Blastomonas aquatica TaxID=1510276 RepID=A0ABQ1JPV4_9SPHN|nr:response regulator [Blastomonas aquatica]GGB74557.1 hypothetical protein GCM10010833_32230 [Blastomonas aquatica]
MILVVEDETDVREELVEMLELRGFEVRSAYSVATAMEAVRSIPGNMTLLSDLRLGDGSGMDLIRMIRSDHELSTRVAPIILMTGHTDITEHIEQAIAAEGLQIMFKPVDLTKLLPLLCKEQLH